MNSRRSARDRTGLTSTDTAAAPYMAGTQIDVFAKVRGHERAEQLRAAREADVLPYFRVLEGPARPVVEMEGAERIMLGSNNYLGLTGDERVIQGARDALDRFGTGLTGSRLLNGTTPLHLELEAEIAAVDGHRRRDRLHDRPPGQRRDARDDPRARRHGRRRLGRPRLDPRRLPALAREAAPLPPQPDGQARARRSRRRPATAAASSSSSTGCSRWRATSPRCRRSATCASASARGSWSTRRTPPACSARAARGPRSCSASRTASTCAWARSRSRWRAAAGSSPGRPRSSSSCASSRARSSSPPRRCRPPSAPRSRRCGCPHGRGPRR